MKKRIALLLALALVLSLTACGTPADNPKTVISVIAAQYGPQTAYWWLGFEKDFEAANPGLDLVVDVVSWNDIDTVVENRIASGETPDLVNTDVFADYQARGLLLSAGTFASQQVRDKMLPVYLEQSVLDGQIWALPAVASIRALYYNTDLLAQAGTEVPRTWSALTAAAQAVHDRFGGSVIPWGVDMTTKEGQACFAYYAWNNGGGFLDADGQWNLNCPENVEALEYVIGLVDKGLTNPDPAADTREDLQEMFASGSLAMMIGPNQITSFISACERPVPFGVAPIPASDGKEAVSCGMVDRFLCFDNQYSRKELDAISAFFDFFYEDQRYSEWVLMEDFLPVTIPGAARVARARPQLAQWMDLADDSRFAPASKLEWTRVKRGIIQAEQQALQGGDVQQLLDALQENVSGNEFLPTRKNR